MKTLKIIFFTLVIFTLLSACAPAATEPPAEKLTYHITTDRTCTSAMWKVSNMAPAWMTWK
jgi:hypothetical protein